DHAEGVEDRHARAEEGRKLPGEVHDLFRLHRAADVEILLVPRLLHRAVGVEFRRRRGRGLLGGHCGAHASSLPMMTCFTTSSIVVTSCSTMRIASCWSVRKPCWAAISRAALGGDPSTTHWRSSSVITITS